jgi:CO/xanthine dehydrogenase FAD-binding subunit
MRLGAVEIAVAGADPASIGERVGELEGLDPVGDVSATAEHRRRLARVLAVRALADAAGRAVGAP